TIIAARSQTPISTVEGFKNAVASAVKGNPNKYFAQVFQALRIEVNGELDALKELLQQVPGALTVGGRLVIITFHSLEDRLVKNFIRSGGFDEPADDPFTMRQTSNPLKAVFKKPLVPAENEMNSNPRARSAKMRVAEKTSE
ncbi:MAG TPA: 16S rRNA (cytosine(1402)-N(4))-methyltransferase, partial [Chitinophagaceae bacterium]